MSYSDSTHFSDKNSYKILCIPSYCLKDMNHMRFAYLQEFQKQRRQKKTGKAESGFGPEPEWRRIEYVARRRWATPVRKRAEAQQASDLNKKGVKRVAEAQQASGFELRISSRHKERSHCSTKTILSM
jgi:hypothetical protein